MPPLPIIIDCDPGIDDAIALLLALASPDELEVRAITVVAGNVGLALTARNARQIRELARRPDVPIHAGCPRPMIAAPVTATHAHGDSGLGELVLPAPRLGLAPGHAVEFLVGALRAAPRATLTLCALGPLTNIAMAMITAPDIVERLARIVVMGGAVGLGNASPAAEYNIYADPHAARIVFESGASIVLCPLDLTLQALATPARMAAIHRQSGPVADAVRALRLSRAEDLERIGQAGVAIHDACVIATLLRPDLFAGRMAHVAVETAGGRNAGRTVIDLWNRLGKAPNAFVAERIDADGFFALLAERLASFELLANGPSPDRLA